MQRPTRVLPLAFSSLLFMVLATISPLLQADRIRYEFDPAFNGNYSIDAFTSSEGTGASRYGNRIVRLPGGDVVTAGIVRLDFDPVTPYWNIGLVRTSPWGSRQAWTGSGPYFHAGQQYVVYPNLVNGASGTATLRKLVDFAYAQGRFYVLTESRFAESPEDDDVLLLVFAEDGTYLNSLNVFSEIADEDGIAMSVVETSGLAHPVEIAVLGRESALRGKIAKYQVTSTGIIELDTGFGGGDGRVEFVLPLDECDFPDCHYFPTDIAFPQGGTGADRPIYVSGGTQRVSPSATDWDMVAIKFSPDGMLDPTFDGNGVARFAFDELGSSLRDVADHLWVENGLAGNSDTVWMAGNVAGRCSQGVGVLRIDGDSGAPDSGFGNSGEALVADNTTPPGEPCQFETNIETGDIVVSDGEVAIASTGFVLDTGGGRGFESGALIRLSASSGQIYSLDGFNVFDGDQFGTSSLTGITTGEGGGRYYVSGRGQSGLYASLFITARLKPLDDPIFSDGFGP